jgi:hypothetical protein
MTPERARLILKDTITLFTTPENKERLLNVTEQTLAAPEAQRLVSTWFA